MSLSEEFEKVGGNGSQVRELSKKLTAANERVKELESEVIRQKAFHHDCGTQLRLTTQDLISERAVSDKLEKALKSIRWQVAKNSDADITAEATLAEVATIRNKQ